jgi:hypothetical protein
MLPGVYDLVYDKFSDTYNLIPQTSKFTVPPKIYGDTKNKIEHVWGNFVRNGLRGGIILTGQLGSGKTEIGKVLSNRAIDNGMIVIRITNIPFKPTLLPFLESFDNVVLFFDEFGKTFGIRDQEKMLTLLSNTSGKRRIVILTENKKEMISRLIRNRPGRLRYAIHYNKVPISTVREYCEDHQVDKKFYEKLLKLYKSVTVFSFDHLKAIVEEHKEHPDLDIKDLVSILNLDVGDERKVIKLAKVDVVDEKLKEKIKEIKDIESTYCTLDDFENGRMIFCRFKVYYKDDNTKTDNDVNIDMFNQPQSRPNRGMEYIEVGVDSDDVIEMDENQMLVLKNDWKLKFSIQEDNPLARMELGERM